MREAATAEWLVDRLLAAFTTFYGVLDGASVQKRQGYRLFSCPSIPIPGFNAVYALEDNPDDAVDDLARVMTEIEGLGLPFGVIVREHRSPALEAEARRLGLTAVERMPAMCVVQGGLVSHSPSELQIVPVRDETGLGDALSIVAAGFEAPADIFRPMYQPNVAAMPAATFYLGLVENQPVSTALAFIEGNGVGIFNVATPASSRGHGYGTALTAQAARDGFAAGAMVAWLQASAMGEPVYRRMAFRQVDTHLMLVRP